MGKSSKLFKTLAQGVKAFKSTSKEKPAHEQSPSKASRKEGKEHTRGDKNKCLWGLGKSSSRSRDIVATPTPSSASLDAVEIKVVHVEQPKPPKENVAYLPLPSVSTEAVAEVKPPVRTADAEGSSIEPPVEDSSQFDPTDPIKQSLQEYWAATKIQAAFRRCQAQQELQALKALVKVQALARGRLVRRQAAMTLRCVRAVVRIQAVVRGNQVRTSESGQLVQGHLQQRRMAVRYDSSAFEGLPSQVIDQRKGDSLKWLGASKSAFLEQILECMPNHSSLVIDAGSDDNSHWGWMWLNRWTAARPWDRPFASARGPPVSMGVVTNVDEDAQIITRADKVWIPKEENLFSVDALNEGTSLSDTFASPALSESPKVASCAATGGSPAQTEGLLAQEVVAVAPIPGSVSRSTAAESSPLYSSLPSTSPPLPPSPPPSHPLPSEFTNQRSLQEIPPPASSVPPPLPSSSPPLSPQARLCEVQLADNSVMETPSLTLEGPAEAAEAAGNFSHDIWSLPNSGMLLDLPAARDTSQIPPDCLSSASLTLGSSPSPADSCLPSQLSPPAAAALSEQKSSPWQEHAPSPLIIPCEAPDEASSGFNPHEEDIIPSVDGDGGRANEEFDLTNEANVNVGEEPPLPDAAHTIQPVPQSDDNGKCSSSVEPVNPKITEVPSRQASSPGLKHEQGEVLSPSVPSYMAATQSAKAKMRSQASPKQKLDSPKQKPDSPSAPKRRHSLSGLEGKSPSVTHKHISHVRAVSKGHLRDASTESSPCSNGGSRRHGQ